MLIYQTVKQLRDVEKMLLLLPEKAFQEKHSFIRSTSLGAHVRHILEFYTCLQKHVNRHEVCYDNRERNSLMEEDINLALKTINDLIIFISNINEDKPISFIGNYSLNDSEKDLVLKSSLYRELAYAIDHTIHHLAIIKIVVSLKYTDTIIDEYLGVAPSTIRNQKRCVQ